MENEKNTKHLNHYDYDNKLIYTSFNSFAEAQQFANENNGELVELGFLDGNDNPVYDDTAQLIGRQDYFFADAGPGYQIIHSGNELFKELLAKWIERNKQITDKSIEEQYMSDSDNLTSEDGVFVLYNGEIESVTSRERCRYLKHTNVYELAVRVAK